jgi:hypothetical protein
MINALRVRRGCRYLASGALLGAALAVSSCTDHSKSPTTPTTFSSSAVSVSALSTTVVAQPVSNGFCPLVAPFAVPMTILINPNGVPNLAVTQIALQFTDTAGRRMPQVTLPAPVPTTEFGTALAASRAALAFPLTLGIGCGVGSVGTVVVLVDTRDGLGRMLSGRVSVFVR